MAYLDRDGTLSKHRRDSEFQPLTDDEVQRLERIVADAFEGFSEGPSGHTGRGA